MHQCRENVADGVCASLRGHCLHSIIMCCALQVYVRTQNSEEQKQAARQVLHLHCTPLLTPGSLSQYMDIDPTPAVTREEPNLAPTPPDPAPSAPQLALVKPCAWPFPVTASHFADDAAMATLARDAALWESFTAQLAAYHMTHANQSAVHAALQQQSSPWLQMLLPAETLRDTLAGQPQVPRQELSGLEQGKTGDRADVQPQLWLMWQAAACFAERATEADRDVRSHWSLLLASQMKVNVHIAVGITPLNCL